MTGYGERAYYSSDYTEIDKQINAYVINKFGINIFDCPRYRNWEVNLKRPIIKITGRYGGGNREDYEYEIESFKDQHSKIFIKDKQDQMDCTYSTFYLSLDKDKWEDFKNNWKKDIKKIRGDDTSNKIRLKDFINLNLNN